MVGKNVKLQLHDAIYQLRFYWNSLIHILSLSNSHNNVASIQKNRRDKSHRVIVALANFARPLDWNLHHWLIVCEFMLCTTLDTHLGSHIRQNICVTLRDVSRAKLKNIVTCQSLHNLGFSWTLEVNFPLQDLIKLVLIIDNYKISKLLCH